jgi:hypothetical protein
LFLQFLLALFTLKNARMHAAQGTEREAYRVYVKRYVKRKRAIYRPGKAVERLRGSVAALRRTSDREYSLHGRTILKGLDSEGCPSG